MHIFQINTIEGSKACMKHIISNNIVNYKIEAKGRIEEHIENIDFLLNETDAYVDDLDIMLLDHKEEIKFI